MAEPTIETTDNLQRALADISFVNTVLDFKWQFVIQPVVILFLDGATSGVDYHRDAWLVHVTFERPDTITGKIGRGRGRDEIVWKGTTVSGAVKTAWVLIELMVKHELMEGFRWQDCRIFNPHNSVQELADLQRTHDQAIGAAG